MLELDGQSSQQQEILLQTLIGEWMAKGHTNEEIIALLVEEDVEPEEAQMLLRRVYDSWTITSERLNLQTEDTRNWHQYLRMKLLQKALQTEGTASQRLALSILDSLADIQGITAQEPQAIPLPILLVPAEKPNEESTEQEP